MLDADRLRSRMSELKLSQAVLARRVGVSQQTIGRLVSGDAIGSRYLHRIARELQTTPAWLEGETDNPAAEVPDEHPLTGEERDWLDLLRALEPKDRAAALQLVRTIATSARSPTMHDRGPEYRAGNKPLR